MTLVKVYGERNSGTIYLEWLLKTNLEITIDESPELGWKHRLAPSKEELSDEMKQNMIFVCLVKNPYSWLLSMHKRPYHHESLRELSFSEFLKYSYGDYRNPIVMWNTKNKSYAELGNYVNKYVFIKYEDSIADIKNTINSIADRFDLQRPEFYKNIKSLLTNEHGIKGQRFHLDFYLQEKWKKNLRSRHVEQINKFLDSGLMEKFNYSYL
ncbi:MAG: hypothetical protein R2750_04545 [Bacteroidales bacterium]